MVPPWVLVFSWWWSVCRRGATGCRVEDVRPGGWCAPRGSASASIFFANRSGPIERAN